MTLTIGGVNIAPYVAMGGIKWQRNDVESSNAGRTQDGVMHRGRIAVKMRLDVTLKPLKASELQTVLTAIAPETVSVSYTDPQMGSRTSVTMYSNNIPATHLFVDTKGNEYWTGVTFPLIEV